MAGEDSRIITGAAKTGAMPLGYPDDESMLDIIYKLGSENFYKSMTVYGKHDVWQDVYKITDDNDNNIYIKIQLSIDEDQESKKAILVQFKRDEGGDY